MNSHQRQLIRGLIKHYSGSGTESFIAYVAETNCMLAACQALLQSLEEADPTSTDWLQRECSDKNVIFHAFLREVQQTVALFRPNHHNEDHHVTLGVAVNAGPEEIKHAYRILSRRYHPDTASPPYCNNPETFIAINKAYQALMKNDGKDELDENISQEKQWRSKKVRSVSPEQRKKVAIWTLGLLIVLAVVSTFASMSYKKRAMLAGLQQSRGAFIPPPRKITNDSVDKESNSRNQSFDHSLKPSQKISQTSQEFVAQTQTESEIIPGKERVAELPKNKDEQLVAMPSVPAEGSSTVSQSVGNRPNRAGEVKEKSPVVDISTFRGVSMDAKTVAIKNSLAVVPTDDVGKANGSKRKPSTEPRGDSGFSMEGDGRSSGQQAGNKAVVEKNGDTSIPFGSEEEKTSAAVPTVTDTTGQPNRLAEVPTHRQANHADPSPVEVLNTIIPAATAHSTDNKAEQQLELANANVAKGVPPAAIPSRGEDQGQDETHLQTRVDRFFADYIDAYEQRNPILFTRFFTADAEENGKPFTTMLQTYLDLFATTRHISFQVERRKLRPGDNRLVAVEGQFKVYLEYSDGRKLSGSGPIHFRLVAKGNELLVKEMKYVFNTEER